MSAQKPSVGRIVIVRDPSNGGGEAGTLGPNEWQWPTRD